MSPILSVSPSIAMVDEIISVKAHKLEPHQKVTICAKLCNGRGDIFESSGHYIASRKGEIDLQSDVSVGGSYLGVDSMGLFWSMKPTPGQRKGLRIMVKDVRKPMEVNITLFDGHVEPTDSILPDPGNAENKNEDGIGQSLAETVVQRTYLAENVERIVIAVGRLRGALFIPTDGGCYPGIIDLFGSIGGLVEYRAALLASHGYACLALAYFAYQDLPEESDLQIEYFLEAVEWLSGHAKVLPGGIGVIGTSFGGQIALQMASYSSSITAAVSVSGPGVIFTQPSISYKGVKFTCISFHVENVYKFDNAFVFKDMYDMENLRDCFIPGEHAQGRLMMICGEDDHCIPAKEMAFTLKNRLRNLDCDSKLTILTYPKAGHLIEPPYMPLCKTSYNKLSKGQISWGGSPAEHNDAQCRSWTAILEFFRENINKVQKSKL